MNITRPILSLACSLLLAPALFADEFHNHFNADEWTLSGSSTLSSGHIVTTTSTSTSASFSWNTHEGTTPFSFEKGDTLQMDFSLLSGPADTPLTANHSYITFDIISGTTKKDIHFFSSFIDGKTKWMVVIGEGSSIEYNYRGGDIILSLTNLGDGNISVSVGERWVTDPVTGTLTYDQDQSFSPEINVENSNKTVETVTFKSFEKTKAVPEPTTVVLSLIGMM
ncbi:MAG: hypothetical protein RR138_07330, partial [Akkermansia sp.]